MSNRWCECPGHQNHDFRELTDFYSTHFLPTGWRLEYWTDKEGNKRRSAEILASSVYFGDSKPKDGENAGGKAKAGKDDDFHLPEGFGTGGDSFADLADDDGDLPF